MDTSPFPFDDWTIQTNGHIVWDLLEMNASWWGEWSLTSDVGGVDAIVTGRNAPSGCRKIGAPTYIMYITFISAKVLHILFLLSFFL